ncbi:MAG: hypothetical protein K2M87_07800 [Muribaculaceae bacterium]|nr:hypothetical protein [Muribaculaceae bacterium]
MDNSNNDLKLKVTLWLLAILGVGVIVCAVLAILKVAIGALVVVAGILAILWLICWYGYDKLRKRS